MLHKLKVFIRRKRKKVNFNLIRKFYAALVVDTHIDNIKIFFIVRNG